MIGRTVGHYKIVAKLETLLSMPSHISVPLLDLDPRWDPLRDDPRFQAMLDRHDALAGVTD